LLPNYKKHFRAQKKYKGNGLSNSYIHVVFGPPYHALTWKGIYLMVEIYKANGIVQMVGNNHKGL
jgi:hypothetical protein